MTASTGWGQLYRDHVAALGALATDLTDDELALVVPATPAWTIHDVLAHLAGGAADSVTGRMDGAPRPEWTARHVGEREAIAVADLVAELESNAPAVSAAADEAQTPAIVWDVAVHHADLHEALGKNRLDASYWQPVVDMVGPMRAPDLVGSVDPYELFRGAFSRRSVTQISGWGVDAEAAAAVGIFGPRDDDQPVPTS